MADNDDSKKLSPLVESVKQKLIDELLAASERAKNDDGSIDTEQLRRDQLAILQKYDEQAGSAAEIFARLGKDVSATQKFAKGGARTLDELLVSKEPWPFEDISELSDRFGPLPSGYCYRFLAPATWMVPKNVANSANNVIRLPSALNLVVDAHFDLPGDEIMDRSLGDWLPGQSAELSRLWTLRVLSFFGILKRSEVPAAKISKGSVPSVGAATEALPKEMELDPSLSALLQCFKREAVSQYDGEESEDDVSALGGVSAKRDTFLALMKIGKGAALKLRMLLDDPDIGVRVSAATYLLQLAPQIGMPVLQEIAATRPVDEDQKRARSAALHAQQAIWMYEDGKVPRWG